MSHPRVHEVRIARAHEPAQLQAVTSWSRNRLLVRFSEPNNDFTRESESTLFCKALYSNEPVQVASGNPAPTCNTLSHSSLLLTPPSSRCIRPASVPRLIASPFPCNQHYPATSHSGTAPYAGRHRLTHNPAQRIHRLAQGEVGSGFDISAGVLGSRNYT
jgi:hypothetical protein